MTIRGQFSFLEAVATTMQFLLEFELGFTARTALQVLLPFEVRNHRANEIAPGDCSERIERLLDDLFLVLLEDHRNYNVGKYGGWGHCQISVRGSIAAKRLRVSSLRPRSQMKSCLRCLSCPPRMRMFWSDIVL